MKVAPVSLIFHALHVQHRRTIPRVVLSRAVELFNLLHDYEEIHITHARPWANVSPRAGAFDAKHPANQTIPKRFFFCCHFTVPLHPRCHPSAHSHTQHVLVDP